MNILTDEPDALGNFDLIVANEILWYLLDGVKGVFAKFAKVLYGGGYWQSTNISHMSRDTVKKLLMDWKGLRLS
jgi:chemotaxis methyl-accepting protein methylase